MSVVLAVSALGACVGCSRRPVSKKGHTKQDWGCTGREKRRIFPFLPDLTHPPASLVSGGHRQMIITNCTRMCVCDPEAPGLRADEETSACLHSGGLGDILHQPSFGLIQRTMVVSVGSGRDVSVVRCPLSRCPVVSSFRSSTQRIFAIASAYVRQRRFFRGGALADAPPPPRDVRRCPTNPWVSPLPPYAVTATDGGRRGCHIRGDQVHRGRLRPERAPEGGPVVGVR